MICFVQINILLNFVVHEVISTKQDTMLCQKNYDRVTDKILPGPLAPGRTLPSRNMTAFSYSCTICETEKRFNL